jgi:RNA polymerase sigma-70 factor (ECF subfamily)
MQHKKEFVESSMEQVSAFSYNHKAMDETALIHSAVDGDLDAFNRLILAYQESAFNVALRMLGEVPAAEDATQNAFISAYRNIHQYRGGSFKAWVFRMVTNACYDELRRRQRRPTVSLEDDGEGDQAPLADSLAAADPSTPDPQAALEQQELEHAIQHCLDNLPVEFRSAVILADIEGLDYEDIARASGIPLGTIKSRLARARFKLRDCLKAFEELLPARFRLINKEIG